MNIRSGSWLNTLDQWLVLLVLASLPLFSIRGFTFGISATVIVLAVILLRSLLSTKLGRNAIASFNRFDVLIVVYLAIAAVSGVATTNQIWLDALIGSTAYFLLYVGFKIHLCRIPEERIFDLCVYGVQIGVVIYLAIALYALVQTGSLSFSSFTYYSFTFRIYASIHQVFGDSAIDQFSSRDIMRNTIGEGFAFFAIVMYAALLKKYRYASYFLVLTLLIVLLTFSRRALVEVVVGYFVVSYMFQSFRTNKMQLFLGVALVSVVLWYAFSGAVEYEHRFSLGQTQGRLEHYAEGFSELSRNVIFGVGYAEKVGGIKHFHNFVGGSFYMLGVAGLILSFFIYGYIFKYFIRYARQRNQYAIFAVVPLVGPMVSSLVDGLFGPIVWISLGFLWRYSARGPLDHVMPVAMQSNTVRNRIVRRW